MSNSSSSFSNGSDNIKALSVVNNGFSNGLPSSSSPQRLNNLRHYKQIHEHCATCITPLKCIKKPLAHLYDSSVFTYQEIFSHMLNVDNYAKNNDLSKTTTNKKGCDQLKLCNGKGSVGLANGHHSNGDIEQEEDDECDDHQTICPVIQCPNEECTVITHFCKLSEHFLLCQFQKVINSLFFNLD